MARRIARASVYLALVWTCCIEASAQDTIALPQITVNAPSPIVRRPPARPPAQPPARPAATAPVPTPPTAEAMQGTLPIVADQFATVTVVPDEEIRRSPGATLGDLLFSKPGITGSSFAPGAASRPIIRGLDSYRVRIQENGLAVGDVSDLAEDHSVPIDPLAARQIEVIRGPATLRYGSQAIGGVVNADNNRIPTWVPPRGIAAELDGALSIVDSGLEGAVLLDAGKDNFAIHADAHGRRAGNYRIPSYPYLPPADQTLPFNGRQPNSAMRSDGQSIGGSYIFEGGFVGAAISRFASLYRVPGLEATETNTRIDLEQTKLTSKGEFRPQGPGIDAIRFWFGHTDYKHHELANEGGFDGVHQTFTNRSQEGRVEAQFAPVNVGNAILTTAVGVQGANQNLEAPGVEGGLFDPNQTRSLAGYIFNELRLSPVLRMQASGRIEAVNVTGSVPDLLIDPTLVIGRDRDFLPKSGAVGVLHDLPWGMVGSATAQYVERAPRAPELLSRGIHEATGTFDIGNPNLDIEVAKSVEVGIRRPIGPFRFEATAYYTRYNGFIFRQLTGETCDADVTSCSGVPFGGPGGELNQAVYSQRDATFRGGEFQFQWDVHWVWDGFFGVDGQYDTVRATFTDGTNVPRIPPQRLGGGLYFRSMEWLARVSLLHAFAQNDIAIIGETSTGSYNLLKVELSRTENFKNHPAGIRQVSVGIVGNNLLNEDIRNHVSFKKDEVLLPGVNVRAFASVRY